MVENKEEIEKLMNKMMKDSGRIAKYSTIFHKQIL